MRKISHWPPVLGVGLLAAASALVAAASPAAAAAAPTVHVTPIDPGRTSSYAGAIDDHGDTIGTDDAGAFRRDRHGVLHRLPPPAGVDAIQPVGINDRGDILAQTFFSPDQVYLWRDGRWTFVADGEAAGLNQRGQVLVQAGTAAASFVLWQDGHATAISAPDVTGVPSLTGGWLNQAGQVAFSARDADSPGPIEGWLWTAGRYTRLPALVTGASAQVAGLNDRGEVIGESGDAANPTEHVAVTWRHGAVHRLATPPGTSNLNDTVTGINNRGEVVGTNDTPDTPPVQAVLWPSATAPATLLDPGAWGSGPKISDAGQAVFSSTVVTGIGQVHTEALAWRDGRLADLGPGSPAAQNERGQVTMDIYAGGTVQAALATIDWGT